MTRRHRVTTQIAVAVVLLVVASAVHAKQTPEQKCQKGRYDAAAKYSTCQQKVQAQWFGGAFKDLEKFERALSKCRVKYTDTWAKLQKKAAGTSATCDAARFVDNGNGTVTDNLTGLQWEQKTDDGTIHDKDNLYSWSTSIDGDSTDEDGTAFTTFLAALNSSGCFAEQCGWRLPTFSELQTILLGPFPCAASPCIDQIVFGPTVADNYWSGTTYATLPSAAWHVFFTYGTVDLNGKGAAFNVRAVRG